MKATAILLKKFPLTDTSLIVHWCSQEHGLIKTVARGARKPGSPMAGRLDLFYEVEIEFTFGKKSDLHNLREASVINYRHGLQSSYERLLAASYFVCLIEMAAERETPIEALFDLLTRGLNWLCENDPTIKAVLHFERQLAAGLGLCAEDERYPIQKLRDAYHHVPAQRLTLLDKLGG